MSELVIYSISESRPSLQISALSQWGIAALMEVWTELVAVQCLVQDTVALFELSLGQDAKLGCLTVLQQSHVFWADKSTFIQYCKYYNKMYVK